MPTHTLREGEGNIERSERVSGKSIRLIMVSLQQLKMRRVTQHLPSLTNINNPLN